MTQPFKLVGKCNGCGRCCELIVQGRRMRCEHLVVNNFIGLTGATHCAVYAWRIHLMPIELRDVGDPRWSITAACGAPGTFEETQTILNNGIGKGCSLLLKE